MIEEDRPLKIREAADWLGVDYGTIRSAIEQNLLPAVRQGESLRILFADLLVYRERAATRPPEPKAVAPAAEPAESAEVIAAREFAERARRWVRRPAPVVPRRKNRGETGEV